MLPEIGGDEERDAVRPRVAALLTMLTKEDPDDDRV